MFRYWSAANRLLNIISDRGDSVSLREMIYKALALYGDKVDGSAVTVDAVLSFIKGRFVNDAVARGLDQGAVEAVTSLAFDDVNDSRKKIDALIAIRHEQAFTVLAAAFKRISNIIKGHDGGELVRELFIEEVRCSAIADGERIQSGAFLYACLKRASGSLF